MSTEFGFIGWCKEGTSDKIWGYFYRPTDTTNPWISKEDGWNVCVFWGRRGKAMHFKPDVSGPELTKLKYQKMVKKNYRSINRDHLLEIWPTFVEEADRYNQ